LIPTEPCQTCSNAPRLRCEATKTPPQSADIAKRHPQSPEPQHIAAGQVHVAVQPQRSDRCVCAVMVRVFDGNAQRALSHPLGPGQFRPAGAPRKQQARLPDRQQANRPKHGPQRLGEMRRRQGRAAIGYLRKPEGDRKIEEIGGIQLEPRRPCNSPAVQNSGSRIRRAMPDLEPFAAPRFHPAAVADRR